MSTVFTDPRGGRAGTAAPPGGPVGGRPPPRGRVPPGKGDLEGRVYAGRRAKERAPGGPRAGLEGRADRLGGVARRVRDRLGGEAEDDAAGGMFQHVARVG